MAELTPRERRYQKTKQAILQAARDIINEKGADGLSLREIANRIDYSPSSLYEYFTSKDEIIAAVCVEGFEQLSNYLNRVPIDLPPTERLLELGMAYLDFAKNNPEYFMLIFTTIPSNEVPLTDLVEGDSPYDILRQAVQDIVEAENVNLPPEYTVDDLAYIKWAQVHGMAMLQRTVFCHYECEFDSLHRWAFEVWHRGLKAS
jgi:AcrR family transcriptional regulator